MISKIEKVQGKVKHTVSSQNKWGLPVNIDKRLRYAKLITGKSQHEILLDILDRHLPQLPKVDFSSKY